MNRLILIGNGFDLAHGMKTSYDDFIISFLKEAFLSANQKFSFRNPLISIERNDGTSVERINACKTINDLLSYCSNIDDFETIAYTQNNFLKPNFRSDLPFTLLWHSEFIKNLCNKCQEMNWVDIENEFYEELKKILNNSQQTKISKIKSLNGSMKFLIDELGRYMSKQKSEYRIDEFREILQEKILVNDIVTIDIGSNSDPIKTNILNFNYTDTIYNYTDDSKIYVNFIHGKINDNTNPIIFGFGDELDEDYKKLEHEKVKGFLDYIKSFWYFKTSNYHKLIRFIDSDLYQVYILGHSCGLSDRTMLNMIFEHNNCKSIKIFYHETSNVNNYEALTQDISRHFNDKGEMRKKIVPFDKSFRMPQFTA